eukprot:CAMPEP_0175054974 /NCGR_PEP_ID=MMETSP0052_2-20121109/9811_1 /TAXON_ID=51329 ORGANISM="Polytomella parva, Strain SAG 63-3" /NCGR_SAMPLE_ID=MMETSP0052_2 /ASSEMBLY_ACC=CAM_ASM_000194 /LENGTH=226 /DNA_ID=CAMNT_0016319745 /DNA_START=194 /DNA_END=871 /DNA_ORIENTATION=+
MTALQDAAVETATHLWLYLDHLCHRQAESVRQVGGLLVIGTALAPSVRVERQLRGRAGRQGDPGTTRVLLDFSDPVLSRNGFQSLVAAAENLSAASLASAESGSGSINDTALVTLKGGPVEAMLNGLVRDAEFSVQGFREEAKRYDTAVELYRDHVYGFRRRILTGEVSYRNDFIESTVVRKFADDLVDRYLDPNVANPEEWIRVKEDPKEDKRKNEKKKRAQAEA